ncbi:MAG: HEAT repeat domain-containing protein [Myxococcales bacterium]|nr:HEAT repeat domain-containing protein [Myxococcales bacterium]
MTLQNHLDSLFEGLRQARSAEIALLEADAAALVPFLSSAVEAALALDEEIDAALRLEQLCELCAQVPGPEMADALIRILGHDEPAVRLAACEALRDVGFERYAEVARAMERAMDVGMGMPAMGEIPWILLEIGESSAFGLIRRLLEHEEAEVVASAIESLVEFGDPAAIAALRPLIDDPREVSAEDFEEETSATIGMLAEEALEALEALEGLDEAE